MTNKKLGLVMAPLLPLTAIGIVEVADALVALTSPPPVAIVEVRESPVVREHVPPPSVRFARPAEPPVVSPELQVPLAMPVS